MSKTKSSFITHHSSLDHARPVEDYVFARIELQERLHRLGGHSHMAVFRLCGFSGYEVAAIFGCSYETVRKTIRQLKNGE